MLTTERAYNIALIPTGFCNGFLAFCLSIKVSSEGEEGVKTAEVYHSKKPILSVSTLLYLKNRLFFHESPVFFS